MTVQELNNLHTVCELEKNQLLTIIAMSVQNPQLAGFLLTGNRSNFLFFEGSAAWLYDCRRFCRHFVVLFLLYTKLIDALIVYLYTLKVLFCTSTPLQDKPITMLLQLHVIIFQEILLN